ncbi:MAG: RNA polymerase sigma factor [Acidobacteriota bacterium]|nr:RNA polymerase sigma factor [Acidobacteriota bacterium]
MSASGVTPSVEERDGRCPDTHDPDHEILARVAAGEVELFAQLVERHQGRLLRLCQRLLGNAEEAQEAAQETFLKAYRKAGGYRPRGKVYTWLYRIATNHCLNQLRRRRIVRFLSLGQMGGAAGDDDEDREFDPPHGAADPEQALVSRRRWLDTRRAIDRLPPGQRSVLVLAKFEGLSYRQIAEVLEITEGAVESRLFRAMRNLEAAQETAAQESTG